MEDTVCTGCSLLCDDVAAEIQDGAPRSLGLCRLGHVHFESMLTKNVYRCFQGKDEISFEDAIEKAATMLTENAPALLFGWSEASNEAIKEGLALASDINGYFDSTVNQGAAQALRHSIHSMELEAELEYVRHKGEFIIYWGSDPTESLHRHPSRFAVLPRGDNIPEGIESRAIGVVDVRKTETMKMANHRFVIPLGKDAELLETITSEISGASSISGDTLGIPAAELIGFTRGFQKSDCSVIFYGSGLLNSGHASENLEALSVLIQALRNAGKEAYALPMFPEPNTMGVIGTVAETTSAPCAIDFSSGTAVFTSDEFALQKIMQGEFSTVLLVGDVLTSIPGPAAKNIAKTQMIYIGPSGTASDRMATLSFHVPDAMQLKGRTMTRVDNMAVEMKGLEQGLNEDITLLHMIKKIREKVKG